MAYFQIYKKLSNLQMKDGKRDYVNEYRFYQLYDWLLTHKVGSVYAELGRELGESGAGRREARDNYLLVYGAFQGSYTAMEEVGISLMKSDKPDEQSTGKTMIDCAHQTMPVMFVR